MRRLSVVIFGVAVFTISAETLNQYTTLLGLSLGLRENDPIARYLFSISPILETIVVFAIPIGLLSAAYIVGVKWTPSGRESKRLQTSITFITILLAVVLGISSTTATISDINTLHGIP